MLDPASVPALQHADLLVELHEIQRPGIGKLLRRRFSPSHQITEIKAVDRTLTDWPAGVALAKDADKLKAMHEGRDGPMSWFSMRANAT